MAQLSVIILHVIWPVVSGRWDHARWPN